MAKTSSYTIAEIASRRRISQNEFRKSIRFLKAIQLIYDRAIAKYDSTKKTYLKLDLQYANLTKVTICPSKAKDKVVTKRITKKVTTKKIIANLDSMSIEQLTNILTKLENKEI